MGNCRMMDTESVRISDTIDEECDRIQNSVSDDTEILNISVETYDLAAPQDEDNAEPPNCINFLNVISFVVNAVNFSVIISFDSSSDFLSYDEISEKYITLLTPKSTALIILAVDLILKFSFVLQQLTRRSRGKELVQKGVSYWYMIISALQFGWTYAFFKEKLHLSMVLMFFILASSAVIVNSQHHIESLENGLHRFIEFVMIRLPFQIFCGCAIASMAHHLNMCAVKENEPASSLITIAVISLTLLLCVSMICTLVLTKPICTIPIVLCWNNFWIYQELKDPYIVIYMTFDLATIHGLRNSALTVSILCLMGIPIHSLNNYLKKSTPEQR